MSTSAIDTIIIDNLSMVELRRAAGASGGSSMAAGRAASIPGGSAGEERDRGLGKVEEGLERALARGIERR